MSFRSIVAGIALVVLCAAARAASPRPAAPAIKVLWCTGGNFHDYKGLQPVLTKGIQKHSPLPIVFTPSTTPGQWAKPGFADKYDVIVLFFTMHDPTGKPVVDNLAKTIRDGKPAVVIHGTLHSYREFNHDRDAFCEAMGITSVKHDPIGRFTVKRVSSHWIVADWPAVWESPHDELYQNVKVWPGATALLTAHSDATKSDHVVAWINHYGKGRVFGTTLGHGPPTTDMDRYHKLLANGLLWAWGYKQK